MIARRPPDDCKRLQLLRPQDRDALHTHRQAQREMAREQQQVNRLDIAASLQAAIQERDTRAELTQMIQSGRAEARQEYAAWKADQERLALERERTEARREFKDWQREHAREQPPRDRERQRELSRTREPARDRDPGISR